MELPSFYPQLKSANKNLTEIKQLKKVVNNLLDLNDDLGKKLFEMKETLKEEVSSCIASNSQYEKSKNALLNLKKENFKLSGRLKEKMAIISKYQPRNVNKRINTQIKNNRAWH